MPRSTRECRHPRQGQCATWSAPARPARTRSSQRPTPRPSTSSSSYDVPHANAACVVESFLPTPITCSPSSGSCLVRDDGGNRDVDHLAISDPCGVVARRHELPEHRPMLAAHALEAFKLSERIGMIVDAHVEGRPFLFAVDEVRGRLLAALVAAG